MAKSTQIKETKAMQAFDGSIRSLKLHIQLIDRSLHIATKYVKNKGAHEVVCSALKCTVDTHPQLNIPCNEKEIKRIFTTTRRRTHEQTIIDLYRIFSRYIRDLIEEFIHTDPMPLLIQVCENKDNKIDYKKIIEIGSYDKIIEFMANTIYRRFENEQSTPKLLEKILAYTKINIDDDIKKDALLYLEMRHLIIHNRSKADENFIIISQNKINIPKDKKLPLNYEISSKAIEQVSTLCHTIDKELIEKKMVRERNAILPTLRS